MTEPGDWREWVVQQVADETDLIIRSFAGAPEGRLIKPVADTDGGIDFMYAEGEILVREENLERVLEILEHPTRGDLERDEPNRIQRVIEGVVLLRLREGRFSLALNALEEIDRQLGPGIATPNQVLTVATGHGSGCSATEPQEVYYEIEPFPSVCHDGGAGVLIYMADTGLLQDAATHSWLGYGVQMGNPVTDVDPLGPGSPPKIPECAGHGTFGAGVLRCMAPDAQIIMTRALLYGGSQVESDLVPVLESALSLGADIFHLTIACLSRNDQALIGFEVWLNHLRQHEGAICLAPAGNCGLGRPEWPAAFPAVIAVGALGGDWRGRATFSNFGPWVDVYAPGRDLVNAFATGTYTCYVYPYAGPPGQVRNFYGMAKWSGTSFSTPIVTGLIAARMSRTGENARQAAAALLAEARAQAIPGVGPILLPCCGPGHEAPAKCGGCGCRAHHPRC
jgi:Subtilase family